MGSGGKVLGPSGKRARQRRNERILAWVTLVGSGVAGVGGLVDWALGNGLEAQTFWPFAVAAWATALLLKSYGRKRAAGIANGLSVGLFAVGGLWLGIPAALHLVRGESVDWLDFSVGVLVAAVLVAALVAEGLARRRKRRPACSPASS
ncbi:hypothetical protein [Streptomyces sp. NPDC050738]|uniref:hypothetical protein n=1 Tax=Streptomyces sp. NPDC050738 TaxID=3154744 RepID=UPI003427E64F